MASEETAARIDARVSDRTLAYGGLMLASVGWASAFIAGKIVLAEVTPLTVAAARYVIAAGVLLPFALRQRPTLHGVHGSAVPLAIMVVCGGVLYPWLFLVALARTSATNTALLIALNPVFTLLLAPLVGEHINPRRLTGVLLALAGAATVISGGRWESVAALSVLSPKSGDVLAIGAALCWACFNVASRRAVVHLSSAFANSVIYGGGAIALAVLARGEHAWEQLTAASPAALGGIVLMAILSSAMAGQLFLFAIRTVGVNRTVVFIYLVPVLTALSSVMLLGEAFHVTQAIGGAGVLAGVYWTTRPAST